VSAFPAVGFVLGICGIGGGALYLIHTAFRSPTVTTGDFGSAVVLMLGTCLAGLAVLLISGLAGIAGGEQR